MRRFQGYENKVSVALSIEYKTKLTIREQKEIKDWNYNETDT